MASFETSDLNKIGKGFTGIGFIFTLVGIMLVFNRCFLTIGNILLLLGVILMFGPKFTLQFFLKPQNYKGTIPLVVGFVFVIITGWTMVGVILETYSFIFFSSRGFRPNVLVFLRRVPIVSLMLRHSCESTCYSRLKGKKRVPV